MALKPAVSLVALPGQRRATLELAQRLEEEGFSGIYPTFGGQDSVGLCLALALATREIRLGTAIAIIYARHAFDYARTAALIHELSGGRFVFGVGLSHGPIHSWLGVNVQKPLSDMRRFIAQYRSAAGQSPDELPPIVVGTLRKKMVALAGEIADGCMWANGARSHMPESLAVLPEEKRRGDFFIGDMIPCCIDEDRKAAAEVMRRALTGYVLLPNYQNYWVEAGYEEEMEAIRSAVASGQHDRLPSLMSDRWLSDVALYGPAREVRDGLEAWHAAGVKTPILMPSSTRGGQMKAFEELIEAFR